MAGQARLIGIDVVRIGLKIVMCGNDQYLSNLSYWKYLDDVERRVLERAAIVRHYDEGAFLDRHSDQCLGAIRVLAGEVRVFCMSSEGREITLFHLRPGEDCVLSAAYVIDQIDFEVQLRAAADTDLLAIPHKTFEGMIEKNVQLRCFVYELIARRFAEVMGVLQRILFLGFDQRLAAYLLEECAKTPDNTLRMTQGQIAKEVNSAREVVARMLKRFADEGLVFVSRGAVQMLDADGLRKVRDRK